VNVIHVNAVAKNAADDKLRQSLRRYAQTHIAPATVILITGDCNFTSEVSDLRHRHKYFVVLIHPVNASKALVEAANTAVSYEEFVADLPVVYASKDSVSEQHLLVSNLPSYVDVGMIRGKLKQISENCGGKVINVMPPTAIIKFSTEELARRALKRLNGEMVHGNKIFVQRKTNGASSNATIEPVRIKHLHLNKVDQLFYNFNTFYIITAINKPIHEASCPDKFDSPSNHSPVSNDSGVQLTISNIDAQLGVKTIQEKIWNLITQHTQVWHIYCRIVLITRLLMCDVTVPDVDSASIILQSLHRRKLGNKRILVTISQKLEDERTLLNYHKALKLGQIRQLHDFVVLREINDKVFIFLAKNDENPLFSVCKQHYRPDRVQMRPPIKINIGLREFSAKLHALLYSHSGSIVLNSFETMTIWLRFGRLPEGSGVFLEHQISYVPGVQIIDGDVKTVVWSQPHSDNGSDTASETSTSSRSKSSNLVNFARELVDLLKTFPYCCLPCADVSMAYQRHYGHALRTNGFSSVSDMLLSIPHVVQIIGPPHNHLLTLTHRAQVKRFTQEMIKLLKASPDRAILVAQLPDMYYRTFDRVWNLRDYGVSVLSDILDDIPDGNIGVSGEGDNIVLSLPTRERTIDEIQRTNLFSHELFEILRLRPRCRMSFTEFVPAYHRQFGRQCKLSNYGFSKLLDLFESLPQVVKVVIDEVPEKYLQLTDEEQLKVLTSQLVGLLRQQGGDSNDSVGIPLSRLQSMYSHKYSFPLVPRHYNCDDIESVVKLLSHAVKVNFKLILSLYLQLARGPNNELVVKQSERKPIRLLCAQLLVLMLDLNNEQVNLNHLQQVYIDRYNECIAPCEYGFLSLTDVVKKALSGIAKFETNSGNTLLSLKPIYQRGKRIRAILLAHNGTMTLGEFNQAYKAKHGEALDAEHHGFRSCEGMLRALSMVLVVKGFGIKKTIVLRNHMQ
uniref:Meiosis regulator and mRNA stability factor 1 n=1 Tax=Ciona savignyi TaxID=51511 RepID=H2Z5V2_CIOSA